MVPFRIAAAQCFVVATWFGLVTGFAEVLILWSKKAVLDQFVFLGPNLIWMTPLMDVILFSGLGASLAVSVRFWPRAASMRSVATACAFPGWLAVLLLAPGLSRFAGLLLAAGCAIQTGRVAARHRASFEKLVRVTWPWLLAGVAGLAILAFARGSVSARQAAIFPSPARPGAPNVLLVVLDTVRARSLGLYGHERATTPGLERWARTGAQFDQAIATAPWTTPSHASMFTGHMPSELVVGRARPGHQEYPVLDRSVPTLAEILSAHGYLTAGFVANVEYAGYETGLDRGFLHYDDFAVTPSELPYATALGRSLVKNLTWRRLVGYHDVLGRKTAGDVNAAFLTWLSQQPQRPFFAFLNYFDAHEPYLPAAPYDRLFGDPERRDKTLIVPWGVHQAKRHNKPEMTAAERQGELDAYEGAIAYVDHQLDLLLGALDGQGLLDNTLLIVTSDHGELFGEHGLFDHGNSLYLPLLHVPLVLRFPGRVPAATRVPESVSLRDLPATVLDLVEVGARLPGRSLARWWQAPEDRSGEPAPVLSELEGSPNTYPWYPTARGDMVSAILDGEHYIRAGDGSEELYDIEADPLEVNDLSVRPERRPSLERFRNLLAVGRAGVERRERR